jgi:hypothetical protein
MAMGFGPLGTGHRPARAPGAAASHPAHPAQPLGGSA